jgi:hypothetical protein
MYSRLFCSRLNQMNYLIVVSVPAHRLTVQDQGTISTLRYLRSTRASLRRPFDSQSISLTVCVDGQSIHRCIIVGQCHSTWVLYSRQRKSTIPLYRPIDKGHDTREKRGSEEVTVSLNSALSFHKPPTGHNAPRQPHAWRIQRLPRRCQSV